jgi:hypothetical protein
MIVQSVHSPLKRGHATASGRDRRERREAGQVYPPPIVPLSGNPISPTEWGVNLICLATSSDSRNPKKDTETFERMAGNWQVRGRLSTAGPKSRQQGEIQQQLRPYSVEVTPYTNTTIDPDWIYLARRR